jgi:hypothetical protein
MGGACVSSKNSDPKKIELLIELCSTCGFDMQKEQLMTNLVEYLKNKSYTVKIVVKPMKDDGGEYFVYVVRNGKQKIVFSNKRDLHGTEDAIIGRHITPGNVESVVAKIDAAMISV